MSRFESKINKVGPLPEYRPDLGHCWIWTGARSSNGYGIAWVNGKLIGSHRHSFTLFKGAIPAGLDLDHLCRVRICCNPDHLEPVTRSENNRRGRLGEVLRSRFAKIKHCPRGHEKNAENTYVNPVSGTRHCRICKLESQRRIRGGK